MSAVASRDAMLDAAIELFRRQGIEATTISDVLELSGAPRGSTYHYFPEGKAQLAREATRRAGGFISHLISVGLATDGPVATIDSIVTMFRQQLRDSDFQSGCPVAAGGLGNVRWPEASAVAGEAYTSWQSLIAASLWQSGTSAERSRTLATMAIAAIEGALVMAQAQRSEQPLLDIADELGYLLHTVTAHDV